MSRKFLTPILLPADPTAALEAAPKQYVDAAAAGAADEVWIGPDAPAGSTLELWYDTDATNMNDPDTARWNSAWGIVATGAWAFNDGAPLTVGADLTLPITYRTVAGRRYKFRIHLRAASAVVNAGVSVGLRYDGTVLGTDVWTQIIGVTGYTSPWGEWIVVGDGGSHTFVATWLSAAGAAGYAGTVYLEDMGPVALATNPPSQPPSVWINLTPQNGYTQNATAPAQYRMVGDMVQLRGRIVGTPATTMFTLPVGFRPKSDMLAVVAVILSGQWSSTGVLYVDPSSGQAALQTNGQSETALSNVSFSVTT